MISVGQEFKNYKDLCRYLDEIPKTGNARRSQITYWKKKFEYHTEGYKIIIDKVNNDSIESEYTPGSNNHKNMDIYLPYIYQCIYREFPDRQSMTKMLCKTIKVFDEDVLKELYGTSKECFDMTPEETREFRNWVKRAGKFASDTVVKSLNTLEESGLISYSTAYGFLSKPERIKYVGYVSGFDDFIAKTEADTCNQINKKRKISNKISGKQLEFIIFKDKKLTKAYKKHVIDLICANSKLMSALQDSVDQIYYGIDFGSDDYPIQKYWKVWSVTEVEAPNEANLQDLRRKYLDLIVRKTSKGREIPKEWQNLAFFKT